MNRNQKLLVYLALMSALCCVATMVIPIPTPTGGYLNAGDIIVVFSALLAGPLYGGIIGGVGSGLADVLGGYVLYAPGTLVVKGLAAVITGLIFRASKKRHFGASLVAAICGELFMVLGYFVFEAVFLGYGLAAAAEIVGNLLQGTAGVVGGLALYHALYRVPEIRRFSELALEK